MKIKNYLIKTLLPAVALSATVLTAITPISCRATEEGIQLLTGDFTAPKIEQFAVNSQHELSLTFDKAVKSVEAGVSVSGDTQTPPISLTGTYEEGNKKVIFHLSQETAVGTAYTCAGIITDTIGNTLTFSIPFCGYNDRVPLLLLSEVRNAYSTSTDKTSGTKKYKTEFIELYACTDGNLSGVELVNAGDGEEKKYALPNVEIYKGEYIVVHLRKMEEGCIDETGTDLSLATATDSCSTARDLWVENTKARLGTSDILIVRNSNDGTVLDALVFATSSLTAWSDSYAVFVEAVEKSGVWLDQNGTATCSLTSAISSDLLTSSAATRTLSRQNVSKCTTGNNNAAQWIITMNSGSGNKKSAGDTPGYQNSTTAYSAKSSANRK